MLDFKLSAEKLFFVCVYRKLDKTSEVVKVVELDEESLSAFSTNPFSFISSKVLELADMGYKVLSVYRGFKL